MSQDKVGPTNADGAERRRLAELSHAFGHGTVTYPGLPAPEISDHLTREASRARYAEGVQFSIARISYCVTTIPFAARARPVYPVIGRSAMTIPPEWMPKCRGIPRSRSA